MLSNGFLSTSTMKYKVLLTFVVTLALRVDAWTWLWWSSSGGGEKGSVSEALCPEPQDILPCICTNASLSSMKMDCSEILDEYELMNVFSAFFPVTEFNELVIANNDYLITLPNGVFNDVSFRTISIHGGVLEVIEEAALTSSFTTAQYLMFHQNKISDFPFHVLSSFTDLKSLSLADNNLQELPDLSSATLEHLYLDNNPLEQVAATTFANTPVLSVIYLQETRLQEIVPGTFSGLPNLEMVYLFRNYLTEVPEGAVEFPDVDGSVFLSLNNISTVAPNAFTGMTGGKVEVQYNNLSELPEEVWRPLLEEGVNISPYGNPLVCGCDIAWLLNSSFIGQIEPMLTTCENGDKLALLDPEDYADC